VVTRVSEQLNEQNNSASIRSLWGNVYKNAKVEGLVGDGTTNDYTDLYDLINTTIDGDEATILFPTGTYKISSNITIPSNINLLFVKGAMLSPDSGVTITINGPVEAGLWQIFTGSGTISGSIDVTEVLPQWWGAKGDGSTSDTAAVQAAITASVSVFFPSGTYLVGEINLPTRNVYLYSLDATIQGTSSTFVFKQEKRGYLFKCEGLTFTGTATAFDYDSDDASLPFSSQRYEYLISKCRFLQAGAIKAIRLYGPREGLIESCYFEGNDGIYTEFSINSKITDCQFKGCNYMVLSKLGSEGLIFSGGVALGCSFGIRCERTTGVQITNSMIDFCDSPIYLQGATDVLIQGNYISTRTTAPAIHAVKYPDGFRGSNHVIQGNDIRDNYSTTGSACVRYEETDFFLISDNVMGNYASNGIVYTSCTQADISRNIIRNRSASGTNSILAITDDATVRIYENRFTQALSRTNNTATWRNAGFTTENSGEAVITTGNTSTTVNHGLAFTPSKNLITLTPTTPNTEALDYYVSAITSTTFTVTVNPAVGGTTGFAWQVRSRA
jgi:hypothetical protein